MSRPRLLDLFCGAGGSGMGYHRAGFNVTGVDLLPHPEYPFPMIVADALEVLAARDFLIGFDAIHASPPCHAYSTITPDPSKHPRLIAPTRDLLLEWGGLYVIENVEGARLELRDPIKLCGSSFGLQVRRHRYFETNAHTLSLLPVCQHGVQGRPIGVYGDHPQNDAEYRRPDGTRRGQKATSAEAAAEAMGIDWMTDWDDLIDAIPPVFTEVIGEHLLEHLASAAA